MLKIYFFNIKHNIKIGVKLATFLQQRFCSNEFQDTSYAERQAIMHLKGCRVTSRAGRSRRRRPEYMVDFSVFLELHVPIWVACCLRISRSTNYLYFIYNINLIYRSN